ncbi:ribosomal protein S7 [Schizophyllum commune Loenen D]|nr:ribosomal protein S7 [Schizophyllum commune Loenen D]
MLSPLRQHALRAAPRFVRTVTSGPTTTGQDALGGTQNGDASTLPGALRRNGRAKTRNSKDAFRAVLASSRAAAQPSPPPVPSLTDAPPPPPPPETPSFASFASLPEDDAAANQPPLMNIPPAQDPLLHLFASTILSHGHRARASRTVARAMLHLHAMTRAPALPLLRRAVELAAPACKLVSDRLLRGTKVVMRPRPLNERQRTKQAIKWIVEDSLKTVPGRHFDQRLAKAIIKVINGDSSALEKKRLQHEAAMNNRGNLDR